MEAEVLQGAIKTIKQFKPALYYKVGLSHNPTPVPPPH